MTEENDRDISHKFERVYTVTDFYDLPVSGIANFNGQPHLFKREFDAIEDEYSSFYRLIPLSSEEVDRALELWEIWLRWVDAYRKGQVKSANPAVLPIDRARFDDLHRVVATKPVIDWTASVRAEAEFRPRAGLSESVHGKLIEVRWI